MRPSRRSRRSRFRCSISLPVRAPVNASPAASQRPAPDSGRKWLVTPSFRRTSTGCPSPVSLAHHSLVFLRSQYLAFIGRTNPALAHRFIRRCRKHAVEQPWNGSRLRLCRIAARRIYRVLGVEHIRHRRAAAPEIVLRRLLSLDYLLEQLGRPQFSWTRIRGENPNVEGGRGHGSVEACEGSWVGADGGSPKGDLRWSRFFGQSAKDSDRYRFANSTRAQPLFRCLARLGRGKVIPVSVLRCIPEPWGGTGMTTKRRRRFTAAFKKRVVLEALRGDRTVQEIAARHEVHPDQVSTWKRQAVDGLDEIFASGGASRQSEHEATIRDLHAKIGELTVERDFFLRGFER